MKVMNSLGTGHYLAGGGGGEGHYFFCPISGRAIFYKGH